MKNKLEWKEHKPVIVNKKHDVVCVLFFDDKSIANVSYDTRKKEYKGISDFAYDDLIMSDRLVIVYHKDLEKCKIKLQKEILKDCRIVLRGLDLNIKRISKIAIEIGAFNVKT